MKELGPNEGMNKLRHPDCRWCDEYLLILRGVTAENRQLKATLTRDLTELDDDLRVRIGHVLIEAPDGGNYLKELLFAALHSEQQGEVG